MPGSSETPIAEKGLDKNVSQIVMKIQHSHYGKMIPTEFEHVSLKYLLYTVLFAKLGYFFPTYIIVILSAPSGTIASALMTFGKWFFLGVAVLDLTSQTLILFRRFSFSFILMMGLMVTKNIVLIAITVYYAIMDKKFLLILNWLLYIFACLGLDAVYLYYAGLLIAHDIQTSDNTSSKPKEKVDKDEEEDEV